MRICISLVIFLSVCSCGSFVKHATMKKVPYQYFGNVKLLTPQYSEKQTTIPFTIAGGESIRDSAIMLGKIKSKEKNKEITISFYKAAVGGSIPEHKLELNHLNTGNYKVYYENPEGDTIFIQEITIE